MDEQELDKILKHTLSDYRVSRSEKKIINKILAELDVDDNDLAFLRNRAFEIARAELLGAEALDVLTWLEEINKIFQARPEKTVPDSEAYFSPSDDCVNRILGLLKTTLREADICVFTITDDRISRAIREAHERGVKIRVVADNDKANDLGSDIYQLDKLGVKVLVDKTSNHMHHKFALFDARWLLTGSYNWTRSAANYNEENIIVTQERALIRSFRDEFERLWKSLGG